MEDITESVASYREAARHLWNAFFYPDADWDDRSRFSEICAQLFDALMVMRAAELGKTVSGLSVTVGSDSDDRGILGVDEAIPSGPFSMSIRISAHGIADGELREIADWAVAHCPVTDAVARAVPIHLEVRLRE